MSELRPVDEWAAEVLDRRGEVLERLDRSALAVGDCIEWTGHTDRNGYGKVTIFKRPCMVHRLAWLIEHGALPSGELDHTCRNRACRNVAHLEDVPTSVNRARARGKRLATVQERRGKTKTTWRVRYRDHSVTPTANRAASFATREAATAFAESLLV